MSEVNRNYVVLKVGTITTIVGMLVTVVWAWSNVKGATTVNAKYIAENKIEIKESRERAQQVLDTLHGIDKRLVVIGTNQTQILKRLDRN